MKISKIVLITIGIILLVSLALILTLTRTPKVENIIEEKQNVTELQEKIAPIVKNPTMGTSCKLVRGCSDSLGDYPYPFVSSASVIYDDTNKNSVGTVTYAIAQCASVQSIKQDEVKNYLDYGNIIVIGGPCTNKVNAQILGLNYPTCSIDSGLKPGTAKIILKKLSNGNSALLVYGWEEEDTKRALSLLENHDSLRGKLIQSGNQCAKELLINGTTLELKNIITQ